MSNVHTPERLQGESFDDYRARRAAAQRAAKAIVSTPKQPPAISALDVARFFTGQHENKRRHPRRAFVAEYGNRQARKARHAMRIGELWAGAPRDSGQHPKFDKHRKHKQHAHPLRDAHGAYTLTGRNTPVVKGVRIGNTQFPPKVIGLIEGRRTWLAGISAQRGY